MNHVILDTHVWIWWVNQDDKLPISLHKRITDSKRVAISAVSVYELIQAVRRGRLSLSIEVNAWLYMATIEADIDIIPVDSRIAQIAANLPLFHGDPLDRCIIATALANINLLISLDGKFAGYPDLAELLVTQ
ncbi:MAG: type II toxin-antitoxin system VapC family toxin [Desulfobacteraceae bacterium]|jgi:PIN domain nuclease of toxin-antitoxin system|nr:MAG: type II toxin-antitoxin system VapC family toxin [Desulfobacteraceae bacterium]